MLRESRLVASAVLLTLASTTVSASAVTGVELIRNEPFRYGRFEARARFAPGDGVVSSFFLWKEGSELPDVFWNEIDIEKLGDECEGYSSNALYGLPESNHNQDLPAQVDLCRSYHTHAVEWTPQYLAWLLDGVEVRRITGADLQAFENNALPGMQMRFNAWVGNADFGGNFAPEILPVHQFINWVSYSRYAPGAGDDGGDFVQTWREDFDGPLDAGWSLGTWPSPFNLSVHSPSNLSIVDGKAVLSLTADNALGFSGQPPADPGDVASTPDDDPPPGQAPDAGAPTDVGGMGMDPSAGGPEESPSLPTPDLSGGEASGNGDPTPAPDSSSSAEPGEPAGGDSTTSGPLDGELPALSVGVRQGSTTGGGSDRGCALGQRSPAPSGAMALGCIAWLAWRRRRQSSRYASASRHHQSTRNRTPAWRGGL